MNAIMESIICRQMHPDVFTPAPPNPPTTSPPLLLPPNPHHPNMSMATTVAGRLRYFPGGLVLSDDPVCKGPDVQGYLAMLRGWMATFECLPGIVGAVPYGVLSDRWGRRPLLGMSLGGIVGSVAFTYGVCEFFFFSFGCVWFGSWGA
jgi:MFS family permease